MSLRRLISWTAGTGGGRLSHPLTVLPAEELGRTGSRALLVRVLHTHTLGLLHQRTWYRHGEGGEGGDQRGALLEEHSDGQQGHAGALSLEGQVEASLGERAQPEGLYVELPLPALPQEKVCSHRVHLRQEGAKKGAQVEAGAKLAAVELDERGAGWFLHVLVIYVH